MRRCEINTYDQLTQYLGCCTIMIIAVAVASWISLNAGYRDGQIDYANGIVKYKLVSQSTGESIWKRVQLK